MKISGYVAGFLAATLLGAATASASPIALPSAPIYGLFVGVEQIAPNNIALGGISGDERNSRRNLSRLRQ